MLLPEERPLNNLPGMSAVAFPPTDTTTGATLKSWSMYLLQFYGVISVNQNSSMYCVSSSLVDGFLLDTCRFNWFYGIQVWGLRRSFPPTFTQPYQTPEPGKMLSFHVSTST